MRSAVDKSVRDHQQSVRVDGDSLVISSKVGRYTAGAYRLPLSAWLALEQEHTNPVWWKRGLIRSLTGFMDTEPGGPEQAERIRDAQVSAINKAAHQ